MSLSGLAKPVTSNELQLAAESCRRTFAGGDGGKVRAIAARVDWNRFVRTVRFHRVQGLAWSGLRSADVDIPTEVASELSTDAEAIAATNLSIAVESRKLLAAFETRSVDLLFVKGLAVAALAYPNPMLKMGWDIDLLIDCKQVREAAELLRSRGYQLTTPRRLPDIEKWHCRHKESVWSRDDALHVELHTRLADSPTLIPRIDVRSPRQQVEVAQGIVLPTLARDELVAYLCVHGASSAWFRLKWITDFAALLHELDDLEQLYRRTQELGAGRAAAQAFLLADTLYQSLRDTGLRQKLEKDRGTRWLAAAALGQLTEAREPTSRPLGTARIHSTQLLLRRGWRFKVGEICRQAGAALSSRLHQ